MIDGCSEIRVQWGLGCDIQDVTILNRAEIFAPDSQNRSSPRDHEQSYPVNALFDYVDTVTAHGKSDFGGDNDSEVTEQLLAGDEGDYLLDMEGTSTNKTRSLEIDAKLVLFALRYPEVFRSLDVQYSLRYWQEGRRLLATWLTIVFVDLGEQEAADTKADLSDTANRNMMLQPESHNCHKQTTQAAERAAETYTAVVRQHHEVREVQAVWNVPEEAYLQLIDEFNAWGVPAAERAYSQFELGFYALHVLPWARPRFFGSSTCSSQELKRRRRALNRLCRWVQCAFGVGVAVSKSEGDQSNCNVENRSHESFDEDESYYDQDDVLQQHWKNRRVAFAFHVACAAGSMDIVKTLFQAMPDADLEEMTKASYVKADFTPLMLAAEASHVDVCRFLLFEAGVRPHQRPGSNPHNYDREFPLGTAINENCPEIVEMLIEAGVFVQDCWLGWYFIKSLKTAAFQWEAAARNINIKINNQRGAQESTSGRKLLNATSRIVRALLNAGASAHPEYFEHKMASACHERWLDDHFLAIFCPDVQYNDETCCSAISADLQATGLLRNMVATPSDELFDFESGVLCGWSLEPDHYASSVTASDRRIWAEHYSKIKARRRKHERDHIERLQGYARKPSKSKKRGFTALRDPAIAQSQNPPDVSSLVVSPEFCNGNPSAKGKLRDRQRILCRKDDPAFAISCRARNLKRNNRHPNTNGNCQARRNKALERMMLSVC